MKEKSNEERNPAGHARRTFGTPTINVTEKEINEGVEANSRKCMIAEAVKHSLPNVQTVSVDLATIRFTDKKTGERYTYMTPYNAQQALVQFDGGIKPEPFQFRLRTLFQIRPKPNIARKTPTTIVQEMAISEKSTGFRESAPVKVGGRQAPKAALGYIRRFGLRVLPTRTPAGQLQGPPSSVKENKQK